MMEDYCAFSQDHKCPKWEDYMLTRHELEEADRLCHGKITQPYCCMAQCRR